MKRILIILILLFNFYFDYEVFCQQDTPKSLKLSLGMSNQFFRYNGKSFSSISPTIEFQLLKHLYILTQYERFKDFDIEDISNVRDGQPHVIFKRDIYYHIPLTLKYSFVDKQRVDFFFKISEINQFKKRIASVYTFNNSVESNKQNKFNMLYGFSAGLDFFICEQHKIGFEGFFKKSKSLGSEVLGLNLVYMFNLKVDSHEK